MIDDVKVPSALKRELQWFASIITRPIDADSRMNPISPSGHPMEVEAALHLAPSPTMRPAQRIQIYNQQYWWRLLNALHETFPSVTRLLGYYEFNRTVGIPYLVKFPPNHWALASVGDHLAQWVQEEYLGDNQNLIHQLASIDWAFNDSFTLKQLPPLTTEQISSEEAVEQLLSTPLYAQPHLHLFQIQGDLFFLRSEWIKHDVGHWQQHPMPEFDRKKNYFFALYRNHLNEISWKEIAEGEYALLSRFQQGSSINDACEWLASQEPLQESSASHLNTWFQEWSRRGWLSLQHP